MSDGQERVNSHSGLDSVAQHRSHEWFSTMNKINGLAKLFERDPGGVKRCHEARSWLERIWNELSRAAQEAVFSRIEQSSLEVTCSLEEWRRGPQTATKRDFRWKSSKTIPENIVELVPTPFDLIKTILESQPESSWSIKIPRLALERAVKDVVKSSGASESAREWGKEVKASLLWKRWETFEPEVQFQLLSYTYKQNAQLVRLATTRNKEKKQPMQHLYPTFAEYGKITGLHLIQSVPWADLHHLFAKLRVFLGKTLERQRLPGYRALLRPIWAKSLGPEAQQAIFYRLVNALDEISRRRNHDEMSSEDGIFEMRKASFKLAPTAYELLKIAQFYQVNENWTTQIDRVVLDGALYDVNYTLQSAKQGRRYEDSLSLHDSHEFEVVYENWNSINPSRQLAILDYTYLGISQLAKWKHVEEARSESPRQLFLPGYYLKLSGLSRPSDRATGSPERHPWKAVRRSGGELAHVVVSETGAQDEGPGVPKRANKSRKRPMPSSPSTRSRRIARVFPSPKPAQVSWRLPSPLPSTACPPHARLSNAVPSQGFHLSDDYPPHHDLSSDALHAPSIASIHGSSHAHPAPLQLFYRRSRANSHSLNSSNFDHSLFFDAQGGGQAYPYDLHQFDPSQTSSTGLLPSFHQSSQPSNLAHNPFNNQGIFTTLSPSRITFDTF